MNVLPKSIQKVIESFQKLPGVGPKTAQRLAFYLLHTPQFELDKFSDSVRHLREQTKLCSICKNVTDGEVCAICSNSLRDQTCICIVEQPTDVVSLEKTGQYHGLYHILHGALDPLNNIGPDELYIDAFIQRVRNSATPITEVVFATNPTMEGEATALYIQKKLKELHPFDLHMSRLAHGLPVGGDIEYADEVTLGRAIQGRNNY